MRFPKNEQTTPQILTVSGFEKWPIEEPIKNPKNRPDAEQKIDKTTNKKKPSKFLKENFFSFKMKIEVPKHHAKNKYKNITTSHLR